MLNVDDQEFERGGGKFQTSRIHCSGKLYQRNFVEWKIELVMAYKTIHLVIFETYKICSIEDICKAYLSVLVCVEMKAGT
jgi:hypothetical protein